MTDAQKIGEVLEASTTEFLAQSYDLHQPPPLGSLVKTLLKPMEILALVYHAATVPTDSGRRTLARGRDERDEEDIFRQHPQLAQLLRTEFRALVVAYREGESLRHYLPPYPARIHSFVYLCSPEEINNFRSLDFLALLVKVPQGSDELIAACLRYLAAARQDSHNFLVAAGRELTRLLSGEPQRLNAILRRLHS